MPTVHVQVSHKWDKIGVFGIPRMQLKRRFSLSGKTNDFPSSAHLTKSVLYSSFNILKNLLDNCGSRLVWKALTCAVVQAAARSLCRGANNCTQPIQIRALTLRSNRLNVLPGNTDFFFFFFQLYKRCQFHPVLPPLSLSYLPMTFQVLKEDDDIICVSNRTILPRFRLTTPGVLLAKTVPAQPFYLVTSML